MLVYFLFSWDTARTSLIADCRGLLFFRRLTHVFYVHGRELVKLQLVGSIADVEREVAHRRCPERNRLAAWVAQIPCFKFQIGTAVGKARLIDGDAVQRQRMVDADGVFGFLPLSLSVISKSLAKSRGIPVL